MSTLMSQVRSGARTRVPRFAEAAVERARLTVVPQRALGRTEAARTPFVVLVLGILVAGVVGLLMFNTHMQQSSFQVTALQDEVATLSAQEQSLDLELAHLRDPQRLAATAKSKLHMVAPAQPAFIRLADGRVLGTPAPATTEGAVRINPLPSSKPAALNPPPIIVKVPASAADATRSSSTRAYPRTTSEATGAASTTQGASAGRKKASTSTADHGATP
jgi:hypothetical protein